jgi:hypothetical protein
LANIDFLSSSLGGVAVDSSRNFVAGVDFVGNASNPDGVALYDIRETNAPMLIARYNFPANQPGNANSIAKTLIVGNKIYALDGNSGFATFNIVSPAGAQLTAILSGSQITVSWPSSITGFTLQFTPTFSPTAWQNVTTPTNGFNSVTESVSSGSRFYRLIKPTP